MIPCPPINIISKGQRSRSQGHKMQKKRSSDRREVCIPSSSQPRITQHETVVTVSEVCTLTTVTVLKGREGVRGARQ